MKKLGNLLMDVHSQHETLQLSTQDFQLRLIDAYGENQKFVEQYTDAWKKYLNAKKEYDTLVTEADTLRQEAEYINFQLDELVKANFETGEQEKIESGLKIMEHAEDITSRLNLTIQVLNQSEFSARNSLSEARSHLQIIAAYSQQYEALRQRLESVLIEIDDIIGEVEREQETVEFDPERAEYLKERVNLLYRLLKKHRVNGVDDLLTLQEELQRKANITSNLDGALENAQKLYQDSKAEMLSIAKKLSTARKKTFEPLSKQLTKLLKELGIPDANLKFEREETDPAAHGIDTIEILFSANKGIDPKPLAQVASGGEFSRVMFCIKYVMAEKTAMPTLVLDEIDSGISGEIAIKLGELMKTMAEHHQLITITHLPQIAARGNSHYYVYKDSSSKKTISNIKPLGKEERVEEIAKMIGGDKPSKAAIQNAEELIGQ